MAYIIFVIIYGTAIESACIVCNYKLSFRDNPFSIFNPIDNYKLWNQINWFGVILITLLLNLLCPVLSVIYWFCKLCILMFKRK